MLTEALVGDRWIRNHDKIAVKITELTKFRISFVVENTNITRRISLPVFYRRFSKVEAKQC